MKVALICLLVALGADRAQAAQFCVGTSAELQQALDTSVTNGESNDIRVVIGLHVAPPNGFVYLDSSTAPRSLRISGGWIPVLFNPCGTRSGAALDTRISGNDLARAMLIRPGEQTDLIVEGLTFEDGMLEGQPDGRGAGLWVQATSASTGDVTIRDNIFRRNRADTFGGGLEAGGAGAFTIRNNLFIANSACSNAAASLTANSLVPTFVINNTVVYNFLRADCSGGSGGLRIGGSAEVLIANNIFWDNQAIDLALQTPNAILVANDYLVLSGTPPASSSMNVSVDPLFDFPVQGFRPSADSPLIDLGVMPQPGDAWQLSALDLDGRQRVLGSAVDLGAYELSDRIFEDGFE